MPKEPTSEKVKIPATLELPVFGDDVSDLTGEQLRVPRLEVPEIRVSYKAEDDPERIAPRGEFVEYDPATKTSRALGKKLTNVQIILHRQQISLTTDTESYRGFEISMKKKEYQLFLFSKDQAGKRKTEFVGSGTLEELRKLSTTLAKLRYERCLYLIHEGVLKKLNVYGASFSQFIEFNKTIHGQSSTSVFIDLTTGKEKKGINVYYPIIFTPKEKSDLSKFQPIMKQLSSWFNQHDALIEKQQAERGEQASIDRGDGPTEPEKPAPNGKTMAEEVQHGDDEERAQTTKEAEEMFGK